MQKNLIFCAKKNLKIEAAQTKKLEQNQAKEQKNAKPVDLKSKKEELKKAIEAEACSIVLSHNHPSGSLKPSRADEDLTQKIRMAATYLDIKVVDHIIVSDEGYFSFADEGLL